ncbi:ABC transporter permease subunit [Leucobacter sp. CSA1]|uniref:ABC transporter permease subunit n=1 Tax=Leucobacter chromiisoli TaxID=2796471 RepID=A0A934QB14_9MICO|nr:ABC transporter permease subunit [Leucobacter chromiisoli]MBK0420012.1 ABC transporter permease subunit [Leucobacter chromiisoli]
MRRSRILQYALGGLGVAASLGAWQIVATAPGATGSALPPASAALAAAAGLLGTAALWQAIGATLLMALGGLVLAVVLGVALGIGVGVSPLALHATRVPFEFLKPIPPIVVLPIAVLVLGPTVDMGVFLVFFGCFVAIAVQTAAGVFDTDPVARATARSFGMGRGEILCRIVLPSALPYIGTAVRVCAPTALIVAVVAGLLGGGPGLGQSLLLAQIGGDREALFANVLILGALGLIVQGLSQWGERSLLHWHPQYRKEAH